MAAVLTARAHDSRTGLLVALSGTAPAAWTWNLCEIDRVVTGYHPRIMQRGDAVSDNGQTYRGSVTIAQKGPHRVTVAGVVTRYYTASDVLAALTLAKASVTLTQRFVSGADVTDDALLMTGQVVQVSHVGANSITLELELRADVENAKIPQRQLEEYAGWETARIPKESLGLSIPAPFGRYANYGGNNFSTQTVTYLRGVLPLVGIKPNVIPAVEIERSSEVQPSTSRLAYAEKVTAGLTMANTFNDSYGTPRGYFYESALDVYSCVWNTGNSIIFDSAAGPYKGQAWSAATFATPWVQVPLVPSQTTEITAGTTTPSGATDRSPFTYMGILSGGFWRAEIPQVSEVGRISGNSTIDGSGSWDNEGTDAPPGLALYVLLVNPPGQTLGGTLRAYVVWPGTTQKLMGLYVDQAMTSTPREVQLVKLIFPYTFDGTVSGAGDGWGETKFHNWHFSTAPNASGQDTPLYNASASGKDLPFQIALECTAGRVYVAGVAWVVGCRRNIAAYQPRNKRTDYGVDPSSASQRRSDFRAGDYGDYGPKQIVRGGYSFKGGIKYTPSRIKPGELLYSKPSDVDAYVSLATYKDDVSGTYTGTAAKLLESPVDVAYYILDVYGQSTGAVTTLGQLGSFANARANLDTWSLLKGLSGWAHDHTIVERETVNDTLDALRSVAPPLIIRRRRNKDWAAHAWYPSAASWANDNYGFAIDARRHLLAEAQGPYIECFEDDARSVVNQLKINYGLDPATGKFLYRAVANKTDNDDGQGGKWVDPWPGGASLGAVLAWSEARYGERADSIDLPGVRDGRMAVVIGTAFLAARYRPSWRLRMQSSSALIDMEYGHAFQFVQAGMDAFGLACPVPGVTWGSAWWRCVVSETREQGAVTQYIEAALLPTTIGGEVSGFAPTEEEGSL